MLCCFIDYTNQTTWLPCCQYNLTSLMSRFNHVYIVMSRVIDFNLMSYRRSSCNSILYLRTGGLVLQTTVGGGRGGDLVMVMVVGVGVDPETFHCVLVYCIIILISFSLCSFKS